MKIETIYVLERMNKGNFEFLEMSATAKIEEGEDAVASMLTLKTLVNTALNGKAATMTPVEAKVEAVVKEEVETPKAKAVKAKATKAKKEEVKETSAIPEGQEIPEVIVEEVKEEKKVKTKVTTYDSTVAEHKSIFGGYLAKKYDTAWKTCKPAAEIKEFTASLNGKEFLDNDGKIVDSFLDSVHSFFGN